MEDGKERIISLAATAGFHIIIILLLLILYLDPVLPTRVSEDMGGVPVMFGNVPDALGDDEPFGRGTGGEGNQETTGRNVVEDPTPMVGRTPQAAAPSKNTETVTTQDFEETVAIKKQADEAKKRQDAETAEAKKRQAETERIARDEAQKKGQINNLMGSAFGNGTGSGSRGNTTGTGTQGVPTGNASYGATSGTGGWGSYALGGRTPGRGGLVKPSYSVDDYGTVVVEILVNPKGDVVEASIGKGTNTPSAELRNEALRAAKRTKFNEVSSVTNQKGTITYKFNLN